MPHDPQAMPDRVFPNLTPANHRVTSPATRRYNCIAWAAGDTTVWWQPGIHWPIPDAPLDCFLDDLLAAYRRLGYVDCAGPEPEPGVEKIAVYGTAGVIWTHAARQLPSGKWTSKLGELEDIEHESPEDVAGGDYGAVAQYLKRPVLPAPVS